MLSNHVRMLSNHVRMLSNHVRMLSNHVSNVCHYSCREDIVLLFHALLVLNDLIDMVSYKCYQCHRLLCLPYI